MVVIAWEEHGLVRKMSGTVTAAEMDSSALEIQGSPRLDDMRYNIHDFTGVTEVLLSEDDIEFMAVRASISLHRNARIRIAFVGNHPIVFRLMDAFNNSGCSQHRVRRFDTLEAARNYASGSSGNEKPD
jgi:hypothetical protein